MRLSQFEIDTINQLAKKYFGRETVVALFGSRTDDNKRGGDIDLFVRNEDEEKLTLDAKIHFLADLKTKIGIRKIDLIFDNAYTRQKEKFYRSIIAQQIIL